MARYWQQSRAQGRRPYVSKYALLFAALFAATAVLIEFLWPRQPHDTLKAVYEAGGRALAGLTAGWLFGEWEWRTNERKYGAGPEAGRE